MDKERRLQIVRQFPENGLKLVLTTPANLRELLVMAGATMLARMDFRGLAVDPTTYITAEYRHISSDLVLTMPLRPSRRGGRRKRLTVTVLLELQSQPDRLMMLRLLEYMVHIWRQQARQHHQEQSSLANVKLQPVLPVVLHTGSYSWERLGDLLHLMDDAEDFRPFTPAFTPLFVSLPDRPDAELQEAGPFGQVLSLLKICKGSRAAFAARVAQTVARVEELRGEERLRRLELLDYIEALTVNARPPEEHPAMRQQIDAALKNDESRLEVEMIRKTLADVYREEGALAEKRRTLVDLLRLRWGPLPAEMEQTIEMTQDPNQLTEWVRSVVTAEDIEAVGIRIPQ
jgi:hypothetical protein